MSINARKYFAKIETIIRTRNADELILHDEIIMKLF